MKLQNNVLFMTALIAALMGGYATQAAYQVEKADYEKNLKAIQMYLKLGENKAIKDKIDKAFDKVSQIAKSEAQKKVEKELFDKEVAKKKVEGEKQRHRLL
ncbi:hypothetical protein [uncultured Megasphaera sp.]|uniref:hypothetical protein n=1 Tax=uncultured Megasphaera sp. TaxID=165188 RepID=UPI002591E628|nr:hypothetical protein [uncultured Megasphaera sp.]